QNKDFKGTVNLSFASGGDKQLVYKKKVNLPKGKPQKIEIALPMTSGDGRINFALKDEKGAQILQKEISAAISTNEELVCLGILTRDPSAFSQFENEKIKLFFLSETEVTENVQCLDVFDGILVYDFDTGLLNQKQKQAIRNFSKTAFVKKLDALPKNPQFLKELTGQELSAEQKSRLEREKVGDSLNYTAYTSAGVKDEKKIPAIGNYVITLAVYLLIIGPPLYFLLKKIDKPNALWLAVPILSIAFTLIIYELGMTSRQTKPQVGYLITTDRKDDFTEESIYFSMLSPFNEEYEVSLPKEYNISSYNMDMGYGGNGFSLGNHGISTTICLNEKETKIEIKDNGAFAAGYYRGKRILEKGGNLSGNLHMTFDYQIEGSITNTTGYDLSNASLCVGNVYLMLGELKKGETRSIKDANEKYLPSSASLYAGKTLEELAGGNPNTTKTENQVSRIYNAYQYFMDKRMSSFTKEEVVLVGFALDEKEPGLFQNSEITKDGIRMITIPGTVDYTTNGKELIPTIDTYMKAENGTYYDAYRYMGEETMKFEVNFPKEDKIVSLFYSEKLNGEFHKESWNGFYGIVKAYNYYTEAYDVIFKGGEEKEIQNVSSYLNQENQMMLILESDMDAVDKKSTTVPVISAIREVQ
ncbi:MAG: hypothetical protein RSJ40_06135, partial [Acetivibrio sp.]